MPGGISPGRFTSGGICPGTPDPVGSGFDAVGVGICTAGVGVPIGTILRSTTFAPVKPGTFGGRAPPPVAVNLVPASVLIGGGASGATNTPFVPVPPGAVSPLDNPPVGNPLAPGVAAVAPAVVGVGFDAAVGFGICAGTVLVGETACGSVNAPDNTPFVVGGVVADGVGFDVAGVGFDAAVGVGFDAAVGVGICAGTVLVGETACGRVNAPDNPTFGVVEVVADGVGFDVAVGVVAAGADGPLLRSTTLLDIGILVGPVGVGVVGVAPPPCTPVAVSVVPMGILIGAGGGDCAEGGICPGFDTAVGVGICTAGTALVGETACGSVDAPHNTPFGVLNVVAEVGVT